MNKAKLQLFTEKTAVPGRDIVYMYRLLADEKSLDATHIAFTTENEFTMSRDSDTIETKDGAVRNPGSVELEATVSSLLTKGDTIVEKLKKSLKDGEKVEVWRINMTESSGSNKYSATYYQGYVTEFTETSTAGEYVECEITFGLEGKGADGEVTLSPEQQNVIALYGFKDIKKPGV